MNVRILSWNIWFGTYLDKVTGFLKNFGADIIGLQEVTQTPDGQNNLAVGLAAKLRYSFVYATGMDLRPYGKELVMGNAILSKYPIISNKTYILSKKDSRVAIEADLDINGKTLHVFNTHLLHTHQQPSKIQEEQVNTLVSVLPKDNTLVMGDFNATPDSAAIQIMRRAVKQADGDSTTPSWSMYSEGCNVCAPKDVSTRLDYIFATNDIRVKQFNTEHSDGSDHLPISLDIEI